MEQTKGGFIYSRDHFPDTIVTETVERFLCQPGCQGLLNLQLLDRNIQAIDGRIIEFVKLEKEIVHKTAGIWGCFTKTLNNTTRTVLRRLNEHNKALENYDTFVRSGCFNNLSKESGHLSEDIMIFLEFGINRTLKKGSFMHFCLQLRMDMSNNYMENDPQFFFNNMQTVIFFHDVAISSGEFSKTAENHILDPERMANSKSAGNNLEPENSRQTLDLENHHLSLPNEQSSLSWDYGSIFDQNRQNSWGRISLGNSSEDLTNEISKIGSMNNEKLRTQSHSNTGYRDTEDSLNKDFVVSNKFSITYPITRSREVSASQSQGMNRHTAMFPSSIHTKLVDRAGIFDIQNQSPLPVRFVNMLSRNSRFGKGTYKSLLPAGLYSSNPGTEQQVEPKPTVDLFSGMDMPSDGFDPTGTHCDTERLSSVKGGHDAYGGSTSNDKTGGSGVETGEHLDRLLKGGREGLKDEDPIVRAHSFSLATSDERLQEFLLVLKSREAQSSVLSGATKNSDKIYRDLKAEYAELIKSVDKTVISAMLADTGRNPHIEQLERAVAGSKNQCKQILLSLSDSLTMTLGAHTDNTQFTLSMKALPHGVGLEGFSNPSLFCLIVSFIEVYTANPVGKSIYLPELYNELGKKNAGIMGSIKVSFNPQCYFTLFKILLERYASVPTTLQSLLFKMESIGRMEAPITPADFATELAKSTEYQNILNIVSNWIRVIFTFYPPQSVQNLILQGPHSSGMLAQLKISFLSEKISQNLVFISSRNPAEQFGILVRMYQVQHDNLQAYKNLVRPISNQQSGGNRKAAVNRGEAPSVSIRQARNRFHDNTSVNLAVRDGQQKGGTSNIRNEYNFMDQSVFNKDLGQVFNALVGNNLNQNAIPQSLKQVNMSTIKKLEDLGVKGPIAKFLSVLMVVECQVCMKYISANIKDINDMKTFLVPHFQITIRKNQVPKTPGYFTKVVFYCPTFIALDNIEKRNVQRILNLCCKCLSYEGPAHFCRANSINCNNDPNLAKMLCPCVSCLPFLEFVRGKFLEVQDMCISRKGAHILTNGGKVSSANHVMHDSDNKAENTTLIPSKHVSANLCTVSKRLRFNSFVELQTSIELDIETLNSVSRFSIVMINSEEGFPQSYILDSGASTSTSDGATISKFYHSLNPGIVKLKVATGMVSDHEEFIVALPLAGKSKRLAVNFLSVEHKFDCLPEMEIHELSNGLFRDYMYRCTEKGEQPTYSRMDFPNKLPAVTPTGLLGIKDVSLQFIAAHDGAIAYKNIFCSDQKVIIAGPLRHEITQSVNTMQTKGMTQRIEHVNVGQVLGNMSTATLLSKNWNEMLGFPAQLVGVPSSNYLCLLYSANYILSVTGNNLWSVQQLERILNCYCIEHFQELLSQSMELRDFNSIGIERLTKGGTVVCKSVQDYISLTEGKPFYRERLEILALSQILGATIKVWISPENVEIFNDNQQNVLNLFLDMKTNHYSPIVSKASGGAPVSTKMSVSKNGAKLKMLKNEYEYKNEYIGLKDESNFPLIPNSKCQLSNEETHALNIPEPLPSVWSKGNPMHNRVKNPSTPNTQKSNLQLNPVVTDTICRNAETLSCHDKKDQNNLSNVDTKSIEKFSKIAITKSNLTDMDRKRVKSFVDALQGNRKSTNIRE